MQLFMAYVLKDDLADTTGGLSAQQICKKTFLAIGPVHRTESIINDAWAMQSTRSAPTGGFMAAGGGADSGMADLMAEAQAYANKIFSAMRGQKSAYEDLNNAKMSTAAFDVDTVATPPINEVTPDLPDSADLDLTALIQQGAERVRLSTRVGVTLLNSLKPWGHAEVD